MKDQVYGVEKIAQIPFPMALGKMEADLRLAHSSKAMQNKYVMLFLHYCWLCRQTLQADPAADIVSAGEDRADIMRDLVEFVVGFARLK